MFFYKEFKEKHSCIRGKFFLITCNEATLSFLCSEQKLARHFSNTIYPSLYIIILITLPKN
jgi:hypothetical protein